jgi:hypothetical protein
MLAAMINPVLTLARAAPVAASQSHDALYETCAALIIAVLVVFYFDERVRHRLTARLRGYAIGSLGGFIGTGLAVPLLALGGFTSDTRVVRAVTVVYTFGFLVAAFGTAISIWGAEDGARLRSARAVPAFAPRLPVARAGQTEREHAAEVLAAAAFIVSQASPEAVTAQLARTGPGPETERLRGLAAHWAAVHPLLIAITAGYPSAGVREQTAAFVRASATVMRHAADLFADRQMLVHGGPPPQWTEQARAAYGDLDRAWIALVCALHPAETGPATGHDSPGPPGQPRSQRAGRRPPKWLSRTPGPRVAPTTRARGSDEPSPRQGRAR